MGGDPKDFYPLNRSSDTFAGGFCTYTDESKANFGQLVPLNRLAASNEAFGGGQSQQDSQGRSVGGPKLNLSTGRGSVPINVVNCYGSTGGVGTVEPDVSIEYQHALKTKLF